MILKTLSHKGDIFQSTSNDGLQYNKCNYCDKVFLNQLYLKSHLSRRHASVIETPQKDIKVNTVNNEDNNLSAEVNELKKKLKEMEVTIAQTTNQSNPTKSVVNEAISHTDNIIQEVRKDMRDVEVSTNNEEYLLNKFEEWKKEEHENYNKEMDKLRNQIIESIKMFKEKEAEKPAPTETNIIIQLHETIKEQGAEILALKKELKDSVSII